MPILTKVGFLGVNETSDMAAENDAWTTAAAACQIWSGASCQALETNQSLLVFLTRDPVVGLER